MKGKGRTLTHSEQKVNDTVFKLRELGMIPSRSWDACDMGRVHNCQIGDSTVRELQVVLEWKRSTFKMILKMELKEEFHKSEFMTKSPSGKDFQDVELRDRGTGYWIRWRVGSIEISSGAENPHKLFAIEGEDYINFLLGNSKAKEELSYFSSFMQ